VWDQNPHSDANGVEELSGLCASAVAIESQQDVEQWVARENDEEEDDEDAAAR
jgi:hypothetical protein